MECVRVYEIPKCNMVSSQCGLFGDGKLERFSEWFSGLPRTMFPKDFLWYDRQQGGFVWYYMHDVGTEVPEEFGIVEFPGGLYAVATGIDGQDETEVMAAIREFIKAKDCFAEDTDRAELGNIPTPPAAGNAMGYCQMDYYLPIRVT